MELENLYWLAMSSEQTAKTIREQAGKRDEKALESKARTTPVG